MSEPICYECPDCGFTVEGEQFDKDGNDRAMHYCFRGVDND